MGALMPFLALGGVTIPVNLGADVPTEPIRIGDEGRTDDGSYVSDIDETKADTTVLTRPLSASEYATVLAALNANPPIAATGSLTGGGYSVAIEIRRDSANSFADGVRRVIEFVMHQV